MSKTYDKKLDSKIKKLSKMPVFLSGDLNKKKLKELAKLLLEIEDGGFVARERK